jgi:adenylate cyclase
LKKKTTLFTKISALTIILSIIIITFLSFVSIRINQRTLSLIIKNYYLSIIDDISSNITSYYNSIQNDLMTFVSILNKNNIEISEKINLISLEISSSNQIDYVIVYEVNGEPLDIFIPKGFQLPFDTPEPVPVEIRDYLIENRVYIETPALLYDEKTYYSYVVVPWKYDNETMGYLATYYNLDKLSELIRLTSLKRFNADDHIYFLNFYGQTIEGSEKDNQYVISNHLFQYENSFYEFMESTKSNIAITKTYDRVEETVLTSYIISPGYKVIIGVEQPYDIAFHSIKELENMAMIIAALSIFAALFISLIFSRYLTSPIKKLTHLITKLTKEKNFGETVNVKSNDEISDLAENFNKLSTELEGYEKTIQSDAVIKTNLSRFLSPQVVEQITSHEDNSPFQNEEREIAVMFADIHGFTSFTERIEPAIVIEILNSFFSSCVDIIYKNNGMVDKYIGDCIMAIFNAPYDIKDPALAAARSALEICKLTNDVSREFKKLLETADIETFSVGIGITYGKAIVGNLGSSERIDYTAVGDTVNVGAHLQTLAKGRNEILVNKAEYEKIKDTIPCQFFDSVSLKSRTRKCDTYKVIGDIEH